MKKSHTLLALSSLFLLSACTPASGPQIEADKTQLYVGVYEGGLESGSYYKIASEFEKKYEDVSFEEGKKGVQIVYSEGRYSDPLSETINGVSEEIFLDTAASALKFHSKDLILDLTDLYTSPMNYDFVRKQTDPSNSDGTLFQDKIRDDRLDYFLEDDGKYYGVPGYSQYQGLVYDIDMFEDYNLYFAQGGGFVSSSNAPRSAGPDGNLDTEYDNGLPSTYDEFFALCDKIVSLNMTPIMWGGTVQEYVNSLLTALASDFEGKEEAELNYSYSGTATTLVKSVNPDGTLVYEEPTTIEPSNGYRLYSQAGRYHALRFLKRLIDNPKYYNSADCTSLGLTNLDAQEQYLYSKRSSSRKRTAMLVEGSWWNKEATGVFSSMAAQY
ncbi:MAG: extracellular solute-binding protein, partial [Candidatus Enteromonas sp.]|nr:extracellular solute-binding protein [Candidatus Enteromonas sp.]